MPEAVTLSATVPPTQAHWFCGSTAIVGGAPLPTPAAHNRALAIRRPPSVLDRQPHSHASVEGGKKFRLTTCPSRAGWVATSGSPLLQCATKVALEATVMPLLALPEQVLLVMARLVAGYAYTEMAEP